MLNDELIALFSNNIVKLLVVDLEDNPTPLNENELRIKVSRSIKKTYQLIKPRLTMQEQQRITQAINHAKRKAPWSFPL
jgi:hypothetical protein|tara:strand:- start:3099 stop:3335 length:237 start_codon:yes stop_codon:yes gene_type:complete